jgi:hypothetical protein
MISVSPQKICASKLIWRFKEEATNVFMVVLKENRGHNSLTVNGIKGTIIG